MNTDTGHLVRLADGQQPPDGYEAVPESLGAAAEAALAGQDEAHIGLRCDCQLSRWAGERRKARRKMAAASRRRNR